MLLLYETLYGPSKELGMVYVGLRLPMTVLKLFAYLIGDGITALVGAGLAAPGTIPSIAVGALATAYLLVLLVVFYNSAARDRRLLVAGTILCFACYGLIALGRAPYCLQGQVELVAHATRYHYAATLPLALLTAVALARLGAWMRPSPAVVGASVATFVGVLTFCQLRWGPEIDHHAIALRETSATVAAIRKAIDAAPTDKDVYIENRRFISIGPMLNRRMDIFPGWAGVFVIYFPDNVVDGRQVHFVSAPEVVAAMRRGTRAASLLVTPERRR
jgi:hypothetical protein